jgi:Domain of unknown function (DUF4218)
VPLSEKYVYNEVKNIKVQFYKAVKPIVNDNRLKKKSIFWDLPYWSSLEIRRCLDEMHIIKNIYESMVGSLLNIQEKIKDGDKARKYMVEMGIRPDLAPVEAKKWSFLPATCYTLSKKEKMSLLEYLKSIKVPTSYSSNISRKVSIKKLKLIGIKSHNCYVLLTQLLPAAIRGILPLKFRHSITKFYFFFNSICSKVINSETLNKLQFDIVLTLCELEIYFPLLFFDIMMHLTIHLTREIQI